MNITVIGTGYVGLVSGACLAEMGNNVLCIDNDIDKIAALKNGVVSIFEPGLSELVANNVAAQRLSFSTDIEQGVALSEVIFIAVGTPPNEDGSADLQHVEAVARSIAQYITDYRLIIVKSTVPVGTTARVGAIIEETLQQDNKSIDFSVAFNPEFLKEGAAVEDFMKPDRVIAGIAEQRVLETIKKLYMPFNRNYDRLLVMDIASAELTKYAANAMLATKISFINEMANLAEIIGADIESVRLGIGSDPRIGYDFIYPGCGYGGSCFPKDIRALQRTAKQLGYDMQILNAVETVNDAQKQRPIEKLKLHFDNDLAGKTVAVWGLAFKPNTNDMREAPSEVVISALLKQGVNIRAFDPVAIDEAKALYADFVASDTKQQLLFFNDDFYRSLDGADCLIILTEWKNFCSANIQQIKAHLKGNVIIDGRNIFAPEEVRQAGLIYYAMGR